MPYNATIRVTGIGVEDEFVEAPPTEVPNLWTLDHVRVNLQNAHTRNQAEWVMQELLRSGTLKPSQQDLFMELYHHRLEQIAQGVTHKNQEPLAKDISFALVKPEEQEKRGKNWKGTPYNVPPLRPKKNPQGVSATKASALVEASPDLPFIYGPDWIRDELPEEQSQKQEIGPIQRLVGWLYDKVVEEG